MSDIFISSGTQTNGKIGHRLDSVFLAFICVCAIATSLVIVLIAVFLVGESFPLISKIGISRFFTDDGWWPSSGQYNLLAMILTSLLLTMAAVVIASPFSLAFAVYMAFYAGPRTLPFLRGLVDISAAIPTIIYAFWGLLTVVPIINEISPPGTSLLAGSLVLALMIFPTITILSHSAIKAIPPHYFYAGTALGVTRRALIFHVILPTAKTGILASMILGAARAIGETMVVLCFVAMSCRYRLRYLIPCARSPQISRWKCPTPCLIIGLHCMYPD